MEGGGRRQERGVRVLYFLSRDGKVEQPHLVRVSRRRRLDVVLLRDVKRWLSELRGEGMPDAFAWACKRRYKSGYVWEDLADDDIITPVSGGEYVLKGSLITHVAAALQPTCSSSSSSSSSTTFSSGAAVGTGGVFPSALNGDPKSARPPETTPAEDPDRDDGDVSPPPRANDNDDGEEEEEEEGCKNDDKRHRTSSRSPPRRPDASLRTAASRSAAAASRVDHPHAGASAVPPPPVPVSRSCNIGDEPKSEETNSCAPCNSDAAGGGRGGRGSHMFRSLLRCGAGAVETLDSALVPLNTRRTGEAGASGGGVAPGDCNQPGEATEEGKARGSRGVGRSGAGGAAGGQRKKTTAAAEVHSHRLRLAAGPHCSQCGREFRPERLHSHMKSCKALKAQKKEHGFKKATTESWVTEGNAIRGGSHLASPHPLAILYV